MVRLRIKTNCIVLLLNNLLLFYYFIIYLIIPILWIYPKWGKQNKQLGTKILITELFIISLTVEE